MPKKKRKNLCKNLKLRKFLFEILSMKDFDLINLKRLRIKMLGLKQLLEKITKNQWWYENQNKFKNQNS